MKTRYKIDYDFKFVLVVEVDDEIATVDMLHEINNFGVVQVGAWPKKK